MEKSEAKLWKWRMLQHIFQVIWNHWSVMFFVPIRIKKKSIFQEIFWARMEDGEELLQISLELISKFSLYCSSSECGPSFFFRKDFLKKESFLKVPYFHPPLSLLLVLDERSNIAIFKECLIWVLCPWCYLVGKLPVFQFGLSNK